MERFVASCGIVLCLLGMLPARGRALGFELVPPGGRALGRAGAGVVGADTSLGLLLNPATLLRPTSLVDASLALHLNFADTCFTRSEVIEAADGSRTRGNVGPRVCTEPNLNEIPLAAIGVRLGRKQRFALAFGLYTPPSEGREQTFGDAQAGSLRGMPSELAPSRYLLRHEKILQTFPTLGLAYAPMKQLRIGASFGWGVTRLQYGYTTFARAHVADPGPFTGDEGIEALSDVAVDVDAKDAFVPRLSIGLWTRPLSHVPLELAAAFTYTADVRASDASLRLRSLRTEVVPADFANVEPPELNESVKGATVRVPQTSELRLGLRYANELASPLGTQGDRMATERWDLEIDVTLAFAKRVDAFHADVPPTQVVLPSPVPLLVSDIQLDLPETIELVHRFRTQVAVRAGGDVNVLPGLLALRAGLSYESHGISRGYEQLDFLPSQRVGLHGGATVRILGYVDVSLSYAHFVVPDVRNSVQDAQLRRTVAGVPEPLDAAIVNAGRISQRVHALALEVAGRY